MNKWLYRAVGAVGVASGAILMGSGSLAAHAEPVTHGESADGQTEMHSVVADLFTPTGGQRHLSLDPQDNRTEIIGGLLGGGNGGALGGLLGSNSGGGALGGLLGGNGGALGGLLGGDGGPLGGLPIDGLVGGDGGPLGGLVGGGSPLGGLVGGSPLGGLLGGGTAAPTDDEPTADLLFDTTDPAVRAILGDAAAMAQVGKPGPANTDIVDPALRGTSLDTSGVQPVVLDADASQQLQTAASDLIPALIADAMLQQTGAPAADLPVEAPLGAAIDDGDLLDADLALSDFTDLDLDAGTEAAVTEGLPLVGSIPLVGPLLGPGGPLDQVLVVGDIAKQLPVVGGLAGGSGLDLDTLDNLPIVSGLLQQGLLKGNPGDQTGLPLVGSLPLVGGALNSMTSQLTSTLPGMAGPLPTTPATGSPASDDPMLGMLGDGIGTAQQTAPSQTAPSQHAHNASGPAAGPAQAPVTRVPAQQPSRQINAPVPAPAHQHAAPERPVAGVDAEYADTEVAQEPSLPLLGSLTGDLTGALNGGLGGGLVNQAGVGALPVSSLIRQLPLISDLPLISQLPVPLQLLRSMPVVGLVADLLPVERGTAA